MRAALFVFWTLLFITTSLSAQENKADSWRALFDGKSLDGWEHVGPGKMVVEDDLIRAEGGMGLLWYTKEKLGDCTLRVVYKTTASASNSGVFIRVDDKPKDEWYAVHHGYEIQICDGADEFHRTGAIYSMSKSRAGPSKVGEWNTMDIVMQGQRVIVSLNGVTVQDFDPTTAAIPERKKSYEPERGHRPELGYIGLQNHDGGGKEAQVYFKEVSVRPNGLQNAQPLPATPTPSPKEQSLKIPAEIRAELNLPYASTDNPRQRLDLYLPKSANTANRLPVVAYIHGGGWAGGDKRDGFGTACSFAKTGDYAAVSLGYRLTDEATWPAQIHDCKAAIRWLRANAAKYNLDPDRVGVIGDSAGGHLVAMLGTSGAVTALEGDLNEHAGVSSRVACVVDQFGPTDFLMASTLADLIGYSPLDDPESPVFRLLGGPVSKNKDKAREASPITFVSKDDPPFLLVHGTLDEEVPFVQSLVLNAALKRVGVESTLVSVEGGGHGGFGTPEVARRVRQFFDKHLLGKNQTISIEPIQAGAANQLNR
jgi:acetyl esterase/lipase